MQKTLLLCFLFAAGTARADEVGELVKILRDGRLPRFLSDRYHRIGVSGVEIRGGLNTAGMPEERRAFPLHYMAYLTTGLDGVVSVDGKPYPLDFGTNPALRQRARELNGRRVLIRGQIETRSLQLDATREALRHVEYVLVTSIKEVGAEQPYVVQDGLTIELGGLVQQYRHIKFGRAATAIVVAGKMYELDFGASDERFNKAGKAMNENRFVRVVGRLRGSDGAIEVLSIEASGDVIILPVTEETIEGVVGCGVPELESKSSGESLSPSSSERISDSACSDCSAVPRRF